MEQQSLRLSIRFFKKKEYLIASIILGISAYYHDSAATLLIDGTIVAAAQEERFTRKKQDASFPVNAIRYVLESANIELSDVEAVSFYDKPYLKFERLLETYHSFAPRGIVSFLKSMPVWIKEKLFLKKVLRDELAKIGSGKPPIYFPEHHLSHAASAFYPSPFEKAAILTVDGVGEWATTTIGVGSGNSITILKELHFPHSLGLLYSAFTYYCGFKVNSGEYKLMGLAPYGNPNSATTIRIKNAILEKMIDLRADGSLLLNMDYFEFATGVRMVNEKKWNELFGIPLRSPETELSQPYMDIALAIQQVTEKVMLLLSATARELTGCENLVLSGGVALNCVSNGKILKSGIFKDIWIQPAAGDAGGSIGAAYAAWYIKKNSKRIVKSDDTMSGSYLGPEYTDSEIENVATKFNAPYQKIDDVHQLCAEVAKLIDAGNVIGWFQGRMEFGPRALGNRSIIGDARSPEMQKKLNLKIKYRESFRPFAPSVLEEDTKEYFDLNYTSPYMLIVAPVIESRCKQVPKGYEDLPLSERLYFLRSDIPSVTHIDMSARVQTVSRKTNYRYWELIDQFKKRTGYGLIVNTSFNVRGEPIVCSPNDAYRCFMRTEMDYLVVGNYLFNKKNQPTFQDSSNWKQEFTLD